MVIIPHCPIPVTLVAKLLLFLQLDRALLGSRYEPKAFFSGDSQEAGKNQGDVTFRSSLEHFYFLMYQVFAWPVNGMQGFGILDDLSPVQYLDCRLDGIVNIFILNFSVLMPAGVICMKNCSLFG